MRTARRRIETIEAICGKVGWRCGDKAEEGILIGESWRLILLAMAGLLAATLLLTPAESVARRKDR